MKILVWVITLFQLIANLFSSSDAVVMHNTYGARLANVVYVEDYDYVSPIIDGFNEMRAEKGIEPLEESTILDVGASIRAKEMNVDNPHVRPDGTGGGYYAYMIAGADFGGENVFLDMDGCTDEVLVKEALKGWKESKSHYEALMDSKYTQVGIGLYKNGDETYIVALFASPTIYEMEDPLTF